MYISKNNNLFDKDSIITLKEWYYVDIYGNTKGLFSGFKNGKEIELECSDIDFKIINLNYKQMKNQILFNELLQKGFEEKGLILFKEFKTNYKLSLNFTEDSFDLVISNNYLENDDINKRYPVFSGECEMLCDLTKLINILNVEEEVKEFFKN